ncbi:hypothetical protein BDZ89DRAFT_1139038 [Hymenopellis radicata]|nr:hypothetical protein BDZ89DRAFT_1139038 [Hymenopellis radicata]
MPPRRSSRVAASSSTAAPKVSRSKTKTTSKKNARADTAKKRARIAPPKPEESDGTERKVPTGRKARKRVKTSAVVATQAAPPNQCGILKQLTETPLDVLLEVSFFLLGATRPVANEPDNKGSALATHGEVIERSLGRARLRMEGLPPMLEDLSEPEYANLLFDSHCHNCLKGATKYVQWQIRMRLCKECLESGIIMASETVLRKDYEDSPVPPEILKITPRFSHSSSSAFLRFYDRDSYDSLVEESESLGHGTPEFTAWFAKKTKEYQALARDCQKYEQWMDSRTAARAMELAGLRGKRLSSVITHLEADGWQDELKYSSAVDALKDHPHVNQPKELTESIGCELRKRNSVQSKI